MDATVEYLWAAGYGLPPEPQQIAKPVEPPKRRGKAAARAKRQQVKP